jgi:hypothetical protein
MHEVSVNASLICCMCERLELCIRFALKEVPLLRFTIVSFHPIPWGIYSFAKHSTPQSFELEFQSTLS